MTKPGYYGPVVYLVQLEGTRTLKIGTTDTGRINGRISALQNANPGRLVLRRLIQGGFNVEQVLHAAFAGCHRRGEWFDADDRLAEISRIVA